MGAKVLLDGVALIRCGCGGRGGERTMWCSTDVLLGVIEGLFVGVKR